MIDVSRNRISEIKEGAFSDKCEDVEECTYDFFLIDTTVSSACYADLLVNFIFHDVGKNWVNMDLYFSVVYRISQVDDCPFHYLKYLNIRDNKVGPEGASEKAFQILPEDMYLETDR